MNGTVPIFNWYIDDTKALLEKEWTQEYGLDQN